MDLETFQTLSREEALQMRAKPFKQLCEAYNIPFSYSKSTGDIFDELTAEIGKPVEPEAEPEVAPEVVEESAPEALPKEDAEEVEEEAVEAAGSHLSQEAQEVISDGTYSMEELIFAQNGVNPVLIKGLANLTALFEKAAKYEEGKGRSGARYRRFINGVNRKSRNVLGA